MVDEKPPKFIKIKFGILWIALSHNSVFYVTLLKAYHWYSFVSNNACKPVRRQHCFVWWCTQGRTPTTASKSALAGNRVLSARGLTERGFNGAQQQQNHNLYIEIDIKLSYPHVFLLIDLIAIFIQKIPAFFVYKVNFLFTHCKHNEINYLCVEKKPDRCIQPSLLVERPAGPGWRWRTRWYQVRVKINHCY